MKENSLDDETILIRVEEPEIYTRELEEWLYIFDTRTGLCLKMNITAKTIWSLCDGQRELRDIILEVFHLFKSPETTKEIVSNDVIQTIKLMLKNDWLRKRQP